MNFAGKNNAQIHVTRLLQLQTNDASPDELKIEFDSIDPNLQSDVLEKLSEVPFPRAKKLAEDLKKAMVLPVDVHASNASFAPPIMPEKVSKGGGVKESSTNQKKWSLFDFKKPFMSGLNMFVEEAARLRKTLKKIPEEQRRSIMQYGLQLCEGLDGYRRARVIEAIIKVSAEERESFKKYVQELSRGLGGDPRVFVIESLAKVSSKERENLTRHTHELSRGVGRYVKSRLVHSLANISREERGTFSRLCQSLYFISKNDARSKIAIVRSLAHLPSEQRETVALLARRQITREMNYWDIEYTIEYGLNNPTGANEAVLAQQGANVHDGARDAQIKAAIQILEEYQGELKDNEINNAFKAFNAYLETSKGEERKFLARRALAGPRVEDGFGPFLENIEFTILGHAVRGKTFIARLWKLSESIQDPREQINARETMIRALADSYEEGRLVCNPGKTQRLCATLAHFEKLGLMLNSITSELQFTPEKGLKRFHAFRQEIQGGGGSGGSSEEYSREVLSLVQSFCAENPLVNKLSLISALGLSGLESASKIKRDKAVNLFFHIKKNQDFFNEAEKTNNIFPLLEAIVAFCAVNTNVDKELLIDDVLAIF